MAFASDVQPMCKSKGERTEYKNYEGISFLSGGNIYVVILIEKVHRVTEGLIDDVQRDFTSGRCE